MQKLIVIVRKDSLCRDAVAINKDNYRSYNFNAQLNTQ